MARVPDLILDSKLETRFLANCTVHIFQESDPNSRQRLVTRTEHWRREKQIGDGGYGTVWLETCTQDTRIGGTASDGLVRAVKQIYVDSRLGKIDYHRELEAIAKFSHSRYERCFVKSFGWFEGSDQLFIAMEYLEIGDLFTYLRDRPPLPEAEAKVIAYQILDALNMMHENEFAHRDMKPNNILIKSHPPHEWWIKLADFGITKRIEEGRGQSTTIKGTPRYFAPEIWGWVERGSPYATDIWAVGEITFEILTKEPAFTPALLANYKTQQQFPVSPLAGARVSPPGINFVLSLMRPDPGDRPSAASALSDLWIRSVVPSPYESTMSHQDEAKVSSSVTELAEEFTSWTIRSSTEPQMAVVQNMHPSKSSPDQIKATQGQATIIEKKTTKSSSENTTQDQAKIVEHSPAELKKQFWAGLSLYKEGRLKEGENMLRQALQGQDKVLGQSHPDTLESLHWLGLSLCDQDRYKEAESLLRRALKGQEKVLGPKHKQTLYSAHWLGASLYHQGRYKEAETMFRRALEGQEKVLGPNHEHTINSASWLGTSLNRLYQYKEAESILRRVLEGQEKVLGPEHKQTLYAAHWLGISLHFQNRYKEAETMFRRALERRENLLGPDHEKTLDSAHWLGTSLYYQARYKEAETTTRQTLERQEKVLGPNHEYTIDSVHWLGLSLYYQYRYNEAETIFRRALEGREKLLGPDNRKTLDSTHGLGLSLLQQARYTEAETTIRRALQGREKIQGADGKGTAYTVYLLGLSLYDQGRYKEAGERFQRAFERHERVQGRNHESTLENAYWLGLSLYHQTRYHEAERMFRMAFEGRSETLGRDHKKTLELKRLIDKAYRRGSMLGSRRGPSGSK